MIRESPVPKRSPEGVTAAHEALNEASRRMHLAPRGLTGDESLESIRIAYTRWGSPSAAARPSALTGPEQGGAG